MPTTLEWGPIFWFCLHSIAAAYSVAPTEEKRQSIAIYMEGLSRNLPCPVCAYHLSEYLKEHPIYPHTDSREHLERFMYDLHESVNERLGKAKLHTFEEVQEAFSGNKAWKKFGGYPVPDSQFYFPESAKSNSENNKQQQQEIERENNDITKNNTSEMKDTDNENDKALNNLAKKRLLEATASQSESSSQTWKNILLIAMLIAIVLLSSTTAYLLFKQNKQKCSAKSVVKPARNRMRIAA